jgi:hypothetical protein
VKPNESSLRLTSITSSDHFVVLGLEHAHTVAEAPRFMIDLRLYELTMAHTVRKALPSRKMLLPMKRNSYVNLPLILADLFSSDESPLW